MLSGFDEWGSSLTEVAPLDVLSNSRVAIEAAHYLSRLITKPANTEPLLAALGGVPFRLKGEVLDELKTLQSQNITPVFIFSGIHVGKKTGSTRASEQLSNYCGEAWSHYDAHDPEGALAKFKATMQQDRVYRTLVGSNDAGLYAPISADDLIREFQSILREQEIDFMVAPYSACAQLAYLEKENLVDAIAGSTGTLLFDVDKVITTIDLDNLRFSLVRKQRCLTELGINSDMFLDAALLSGAGIISMLPQLEGPPPRKARIRAAVDILNTHDKKGNNVVVALNGEGGPYTDAFRRSLLSVKHHAVLTKDGKLQIYKVGDAPGDIHDCIGQRLPDEIYYYLSKGVIGSRVLDYRASGEIAEQSPLEGGHSEEYRALVREQLNPIRGVTLSALSHSLHRFYQHKDVSLKCWFERESKPIGMSDVPDPKLVFSSWNVPLPVFGAHMVQFEGCGLLGTIVQSLKNADFANQTVMKRDPENPLASTPEILYNTLGRFLQLRGYANEKHSLTPWGEALQSAIAALNGRSDLEESVFLAIELARLGILTHQTLFMTESGAPMFGSKEDQRNCLLVSRVASLGKLQHKHIGYTGPLNRHMLAYRSVIDAVRKTVRDLAEVCLATLLLNGDADRDRDPSDYVDLGLQLPFLKTNDCGLGIAVLAVVDNMSDLPDPTSAEAKNILRDNGPKDWFPNVVDLEADVKTGFKLWDAVYAGAKAAGDKWADKKVWDETNEWLMKRR